MGQAVGQGQAKLTRGKSTSCLSENCVVNPTRMTRKPTHGCSSDPGPAGKSLKYQVSRVPTDGKRLEEDWRASRECIQWWCCCCLHTI